MLETCLCSKQVYGVDKMMYSSGAVWFLFVVIPVLALFAEFT